MCTYDLRFKTEGDKHQGCYCAVNNVIIKQILRKLLNGL
jgi:CO dehydrogenase nickel-insertion accessory protein CooC1